MDASTTYTLTATRFIATHDDTPCDGCGRELWANEPIALLGLAEGDEAPALLCRPCASRRLEAIMAGEEAP